MVPCHPCVIGIDKYSGTEKKGVILECCVKKNHRL